MRNYQLVINPKQLIGKCFEIRDSKFSDKYAKIIYAFFAAPDQKILVIRCSPDTLRMEYDISPNAEGKYNLERIVDSCCDFCSAGYCRRQDG